MEKWDLKSYIYMVMVEGSKLEAVVADMKDLLDHMGKIKN